MNWGLHRIEPRATRLETCFGKKLVFGSKSGVFWAKNTILPLLDKTRPFRLTLYIIRANIFRTRNFFPVSNADALTGFLSLCCPGPDCPGPHCPGPNLPRTPILSIEVADDERQVYGFVRFVLIRGCMNYWWTWGVSGCQLATCAHPTKYTRPTQGSTTVSPGATNLNIWWRQIQTF